MLEKLISKLMFNNLDLENTLSNITRKNRDKAKKLRVDIDKLYQMTSELTNLDKNLANFVYKNENDAIFVFNSKKQLVKFNKKTTEYFSVHGIKIYKNMNLSVLLNVLDIAENKSIVLKTLNSQKRCYRLLKKFSISTTPLFNENNECIYVIVQIKNINNAQTYFDKCKLYFDDVNLLYFDKSSYQYMTYLENKLKKILYNRKLNDIVKRLHKYIHEDDFEILYNELLSIITSNISTSLYIKCKIKTRNKHIMFIGNMLLINIDDKKSNNVLTNYKIKLSGFFIDIPYYNECSNMQLFDEYMHSLSKLQFLLSDKFKDNVQHVISFLKDIFNFSYAVYFSRGNSIIDDCFITDSDIQTEKIHKVKNFIINNIYNNTFNDNDNIRIYENVYTYTREINFVEEKNDYFIFFSNEKTSLNIFNENPILLDLACNLLKKEKDKLLNKNINSIFSTVLDDIKDYWIWVRDKNNNIVYANKQFMKDIYNVYIDIPNLIGNKHLLSNFPKDIQKMLLSDVKYRTLNINKNNTDIQLELITKIAFSYDSKLWYTIAKKI